MFNELSYALSWQAREISTWQFSMEKGLFITLIVMSMCLPMQARVGETLEQCVERYGPVMDKRPTMIAGSEPESSVFSKSAITIIAEFHEGVVWQISFRKAGLSSAEVEAIIQANGGGLWSVPLKINEQNYRISSDKKKLLTMIADKKGVVSEVIVMTREYASAIKAVSLTKTTQPSQSPEKKSEKSVLPGF